MLGGCRLDDEGVYGSDGTYRRAFFLRESRVNKVCGVVVVFVGGNFSAQVRSRRDHTRARHLLCESPHTCQCACVEENARHDENNFEGQRIGAK